MSEISAATEPRLTELVCSHFPPAMLARLDASARENERTRSAEIRRAVGLYLDFVDEVDDEVARRYEGGQV